ncbi:uncharacterized protein LOC124554024 [Schistocerca americana]|uniref:uncharacterized protein LOC124554024 n=1 Tax=Schistocerca americana TaxID=7009 RepID=UPI001F502B80|nr:uncharacterized protein LOC124554024 [Schistocerca americana]XP_046984006.1 uncharacterized protein LOC124554024 [Schistocerca americana]
MYSDVEDIEVEDTSTILARRQREDELSARMQELIANFDKYLEEKEKRVTEDDKKEVDSLVESICKSGPSDIQESCTIDAASWKPPEEVVCARDCFRVFSADTLSLSCFPEVGAARCKYCEHLTGPGTWQQVLPHVEAFAQQTHVHRCAVADTFPKFLFYQVSVCDDVVAVRRFYHALCACRFEPPLMLDDILTVFYNWGFNKNLVDYSFETNANVQVLKSKCGHEADSVAAASASETDPGGSVSGFPVSSHTVNDTLKFVLLKLPHLGVSSQDEGKVLAVLRVFAAALADSSLVFAGIYLRPLMYKLLDCLHIETWPEEKYLKLVKTLHIREFSVFGQYASVRALVDRPVRDDRSALKGCVAWAILQVLHGVGPDKVKYVTRLRPECFNKLPPGPVSYSELPPRQLYLSLQMLGDCASSAARADAEDPAFYGRLLRHIYCLQQELPRMSVMDSNIIKCQLVHLDFFWKSITNDLLERQGRPNALLSYMRDLLQQ